MNSVNAQLDHHFLFLAFSSRSNLFLSRFVSVVTFSKALAIIRLVYLSDVQLE